MIFSSISPTSTGPELASGARVGGPASGTMVECGAAGVGGGFSNSRGTRWGLVSMGPPQRESSFRGYGLVFACERGVESVPGQCRTLHPYRKFPHAREDFELAEAGGVRRLSLAGEQIMEGAEQCFRLGSGFALQAFGHHRSGGGGDRAARALKGDITDQVP